MEVETIDKERHLCDYCDFHITYCTADVDKLEYGEGRGNDNVIKCDAFEPDGCEQPEAIIEIKY
jgi:hypothetical protein